MSVPSNRVRHHGSTPPRKQCTPGASWGSGGFIAPPGQFRAGFSEQQQFITVKSGVSPLGEIRCQSLMPLVRSAYRSGYSPDNRNNKLGFRVARAQRVRWTLCRTEPIAHRVPAPRRRANTRFRPSGAGSEPRRLRAAFPFRFQAGGVRRASRDQYTFKSLSLDEHAPFIRIGTNSSPTSASRPQRRAVEEHESFRKRFEENLIKTL